MSDEYDDAAGRPGRPGPDPADRPAPEGPTDQAEQAEQHRVARLLAAAGGEETVPPDVATRLDDVLADLIAGRPTGHAAAGETVPDDTTPAETVPGAAVPADEVPDELAARRRRRRWPQLLVAAATVSVLGLGAGALLDSMGAGGSDSAGEATAGAAAEDPEAAADGGGAPEEGPAAAQRQQPPAEQTEELAGDTADTDGRALATIGVPRIRSGSLAVDLQRAADLSRPADDGRDLARACVQPDLAPGDEWLRARLDGAAAVLVLRAPEDGRRTAEVFTCDDGDTPAATRRIDAR